MPRPYQRPLWRYLENGGKRAICIWHRRGGKDAVGLNWMAVAAHERVGNYWYLLPQFNQARKAIWHAINPHTGRRRIDEAFPPELRRKTRDQEMFIELKVGSTAQLIGSDNFNALVGSTPAGVVLSEWALSDPQSWQFISPILAENDGWALFITSIRGMNHAYDMLQAGRLDPAWFAEVLPATKTGVFTPERLEEERRTLANLYGDAGEARFRQEYLCDENAAMPGAYYGAAMQSAEDAGRITKVPHDPALTVETWWDLGIRDATAIWFVQRAGKAVHAIDYYEASSEGLAHFARILRERSDSHGYLYGDHVFPHDVKSNELGLGQTRVQTLLNLGVRPTVQSTRPLSDKGYRADGIDQLRRLIGRMWFDAEKCKRGISALKQYHRVWDESRQMPGDEPVHDWTSHAADAARVGAMHHPIDPTVYADPWAAKSQQPYDMMEH